MRKTRSAATMVWVSLIWLTLDYALGQFIALKVRRLFLIVLVSLNRWP